MSQTILYAFNKNGKPYNMFKQEDHWFLFEELEEMKSKGII